MSLKNKENLPAVILKDEQLWVTSKDIAKKFNEDHPKLVKLIKGLKCPKDFIQFNFLLNQSDLEEFYMVSKDGFLFVTMSLNSEEANELKIKIINRFNQMERWLKRARSRQFSFDWKAARVQSILPQKQKTDTIQKFKGYASVQGSKNPDKYFLLIQEMEYNAIFEGGYKHLKLLSKYFPASKTLKDLLDINQIFTLINADRIVEKALIEGMDKNLYYKDIFKLAKQRVLDFVNLIGKDKVLIEEPQN